MGRLDPLAMLEELPEDLFQRWLEFFRFHPFGARAANDRAEKLCRSVFEAQGVSVTEETNLRLRYVAPED